MPHVVFYRFPCARLDDQAAFEWIQLRGRFQKRKEVEDIDSIKSVSLEVHDLKGQRVSHGELTLSKVQTSSQEEEDGVETESPKDLVQDGQGHNGADNVDDGPCLAALRVHCAR